jgi:hypothetical protein
VIVKFVRNIVLGLALVSIASLGAACHKNKNASTMENSGGSDMGSGDGSGSDMGGDMYGGGMDPCNGGD